MPVPTYTGAVSAQTDPTKTPMTITGRSGQSVDILDVTLTSGGTKVLAVDSTGILTTATGASAATLNFGNGTAGQQGALTFSSNAFRFLAASNSSSNNFGLNSAGLVSNSNIYCSNVSLTAPSVPTSVNTGDIIAQRSASTGRILLGGATHEGYMDYNIINTAPGFAFQNESGYAPISGGAYTNASDASLKANIAPIASGHAEVLALKPSSFTWKATEAPGLGFIAQDVAAVLPDLVTTDTDGIMGVNYDGIIPVVVKAIQEMTAKLKAAGVAGF